MLGVNQRGSNKNVMRQETLIRMTASLSLQSIDHEIDFQKDLEEIKDEVEETVEWIAEGLIGDELDEVINSATYAERKEINEELKVEGKDLTFRHHLDYHMARRILERRVLEYIRLEIF